MSELSNKIRESELYNEDFAPVPPESRTWTRWNYASIWIGMAVCVPTYMLASSLIEEGMNWWQSMLTILLGNVIVLIPLVLNGHPGTKYGIPFPVLIRSSFGTRGAVFVALMRALVACGWFGIQCWIGGSAIYQLLLVLIPEMSDSMYLGDLIGLNLAQLGCFFIFWFLNIWVIYRGIDTIKKLESWSAPFLLLMGVLLFIWAYKEVGSFSDILGASESIRGQNSFSFWKVFWPGLTAIVGFWATLSLNIPDFSRYAVSQKAQIQGQALGLPTTMGMFSFIGIFVTSATFLIYGEAIWNPVDLLGKFSSPFVIILSMLALTVATLSTNIAANVVASANDISNVNPKKLSFKKGGYITGIIGVVILPWKLIADPHGFIFLWLIAYSALLGAVAGVMLCDYFVIRKTSLNLTALFDPEGEYSKWNKSAWLAFGISLIPVFPGFFVQVGIIPANVIGGFLNELYSYAWFVTLTLSFGIYYLTQRKAGQKM